MKIKYQRAKPYFSGDDRKDILSKIDNILTTLRFIENKERKGEKIQQIKNSNIQKCITWCEKNSFDIKCYCLLIIT